MYVYVKASYCCAPAPKLFIIIINTNPPPSNKSHYVIHLHAFG